MPQFEDNPNEKQLHIDMSGPFIPRPSPLPTADEPAIDYGQFVDPQDQAKELHGFSVLGPFDGCAGEVVETFYASGSPPLGMTQAIVARRSTIEYDTNNEPLTGGAPPAWSQNTPNRLVCLPLPPRHDQAAYHVSAGDAVTILTGRDGRHYYISDELPFVAVVIDSTTEGGGSETKEDFNGGAGNVSLCVLRQALSGAVGGTGPSFGDLQDASSVDVEYTGVKFVGPTNVNHGYRVGDYVKVTRRGAYYFCESTRQGFFAQVLTTGPAGEAEPADEGYYVKETDWTIGYTGGAADYTVSTAIRTAAVAGQSGVNGRWVLAINRSLRDTGHDLAVDGTIFVWVNIIADPVTGEVGYSFYHQPAVGYEGSNDLIEFGKPTTAFSSGTTITLDPCSAAGADNGKANVVVYLAAERSTIEIPYAVTRIFSFHRFSQAEAGVDGVLIGFPAGSHGNPISIGSTPEGTETADSDTWDRSSQGAYTGVSIKLTTRVVYNHTGDELLYGFWRGFTWDAEGKLADVTAETRYTIDTPDDCP